MKTLNLTRGNLFWTDLCSYWRVFWMSNLNFSSCNCSIHMGVENFVLPSKQPFAYFVFLIIFPFIFWAPILLAFSYRFPRPLTISVALPWAVSPSGFFLKCDADTGHCCPAVEEHDSIASGCDLIFTPQDERCFHTSTVQTALLCWVILSSWFIITTDHFLQKCCQTIAPSPGSGKFIMPD